jgi:hypothetical protein
MASNFNKSLQELQEEQYAEAGKDGAWFPADTPRHVQQQLRTTMDANPLFKGDPMTPESLRNSATQVTQELHKTWFPGSKSEPGGGAWLRANNDLNKMDANPLHHPRFGPPRLLSEMTPQQVQSNTNTVPAGPPAPVVNATTAPQTKPVGGVHPGNIVPPAAGGLYRPANLAEQAGQENIRATEAPTNIWPAHVDWTKVNADLRHHTNAVPVPIVVTSGARPGRGAGRTHGETDSTGIDVAPRDWKHKNAVMQYYANLGYAVIDEQFKHPDDPTWTGPHIHVQRPWEGLRAGIHTGNPQKPTLVSASGATLPPPGANAQPAAATPPAPSMESVARAVGAMMPAPNYDAYKPQLTPLPAAPEITPGAPLATPDRGDMAPLPMPQNDGQANMDYARAQSDYQAALAAEDSAGQINALTRMAQAIGQNAWTGAAQLGTGAANVGIVARNALSNAMGALMRPQDRLGGMSPYALIAGGIDMLDRKRTMSDAVETMSKAQDVSTKPRLQQAALSESNMRTRLARTQEWLGRLQPKMEQDKIMAEWKARLMGEEGSDRRKKLDAIVSLTTNANTTSAGLSEAALRADGTSSSKGNSSGGSGKSLGDMMRGVGPLPFATPEQRASSLNKLANFMKFINPNMRIEDYLAETRRVAQLAMPHEPPEAVNAKAIELLLQSFAEPQ